MGHTASVLDKLPSTTPIFNVLYSRRWIQELRTFYDELRIRRNQAGQSLVAFHKEHLGRQSFCYTTFRRYWVWDRPTWRVFINREMGVGLEIPEGATKKQAQAAFREYRKELLGHQGL